MARRINAAIGEGVLLADAALALALPPPVFGLVPDGWTSGGAVVPEFDLEIWANGATNLTGAAIYGASPHPLVVADDVFTAEADDEKMTAVAHGLLTGDGPFRVSNSGGALPTGLAAGTDYWIEKFDDDVFYLCLSREDALAGEHVSISTDGTGTHTISDTADTERLHWHSHGLLGLAGDGAITLTAQLSYRVRVRHSPRIVAYAVVATLSASDPEAVSAAIYPIVER
jgi:hypothetical protein